jgi:hypothetical protein
MDANALYVQVKPVAANPNFPEPRLDSFRLANGSESSYGRSKTEARGFR